MFILVIMGSPLSACGTWGGAKALFTLYELNWIHRTELESWTRANKWERSHRMNWSSWPGLLYEVGRCDVRWTVRMTNAWSNWVDSNWVSSVQLMCCERGVGEWAATRWPSSQQTYQFPREPFAMTADAVTHRRVAVFWHCDGQILQQTAM